MRVGKRIDLSSTFRIENSVIASSYSPKVQNESDVAVLNIRIFEEIFKEDA